MTKDKSKLVETITKLEAELKDIKGRVTSKDYYQGAALGAIIASVIWIGLIFIF